jgi:kanamycin kinase/aminoglycoside 3'-phosphotransferase-2
MAERHRAWRCSEVWRNHVVTWRLEHDDGSVRYLKVGPRHWWPGLGAEAARMRWARGHLPVPEVLAFGQDADVEWLLTAALPGTRVFNEELHHRPEVLVPLLARSLLRFHDAPRRSCPFDFTIATALAQIRERLERGLFDRKGKLDPKYHRVTTAEAAMEELERTRPAEEDLVVCHGDYCPQRARRRRPGGGVR